MKIKITAKGSNFIPYAGIALWTVIGAMEAAAGKWHKVPAYAAVCLFLIWMTCLPRDDA
jgi:hypothetical protein